ncbi:MAG TPA: hypothetical protein ENJ95_00325 [Bacteroidetes bacterium]|nr:hypothetical protein [Bacteroidota bacterium]
MRIKGKKTKKPIRPVNFLLPLLAGLLVLFMVWGHVGRTGGGDYYFCDMETTVDGGRYFHSDGHKFDNGETQTDEFSMSGKYSARCDASHQFGPGITIKNIYSGDVIEASIWRKGDYGFGRLVVQGADGWKYNQESGEVGKISNGWEQVKIKVAVPLGVDNRSAKVFAYYVSSSQGLVYFDDLKIRRSKNPKPKALPTADFTLPHLRLQVDGQGYEKLQMKRAEALSKSILIAGKADLIKAKLHSEEGVVPVHVRLKGDLTDHLMGSKWSFRIVADDKGAWRGMPEFSVHNSLSRYHLNEWLFHQLMLKEDILTTRYDFAEMALNDKTLGIYAYEEHFREALLNHRGRMVAPIIRWNEDGLWQNASKGFQNPPPWFESAHLETFGGKKILKDKEQRAYFETAQNLLFSFTQGNKTAEEVFDTDRLAKFLVITDLGIAYHALNHTNLRFYFNPITAKLEPVGYDGYTPDGTQFFKLPLMTGSKINGRSDDHKTVTTTFSFIHKPLFTDPAFAEKYAHYLETMTDEAYLGKLKTELINEIREREKFIRQEYTGYKFDWDYYFRNAKEIRKVLYPLENIALKAYLDGGYISLESYHILPLEILGYGNKTIQQRPKERLVLEAFDDAVPVRRYRFPFAGKAKYVFCKTPGTGKILKVPVFKWPAPAADPPALPTADLKKLAALDFMKITKRGDVLLRPGRHILREDLLIPAGHVLKIPAGTSLVLENGAAIVSQSAVRFLGTPEHPVTIISENKTGQGLLVLQTEKRSVLQHVIFKNLNARHRNGQATEAAVTFYAADVGIYDCSFENALAKDGLALVHSGYELKNCRFSNMAGDAIDADFSTGTMEDLLIETTGKDGIEISGGSAKIGRIEVQNALGAGLKANRHALVSAELVNVGNSKQGIAAIDLAELKVNYLALKNVQQGMVAFQKLPDFGGGKMEVKNYEAEGGKDLFLMEEGSEILLKGKAVEAH